MYNFSAKREEVGNPKFKARNPKQSRNSNDPNPKQKSTKTDLHLFQTFEFAVLNLFRISDFDIRV